ncbi:MAG: hypothetical protein R6U89_07550 [Dehalococcoidia bacterium]
MRKTCCIIFALALSLSLTLAPSLVMAGDDDDPNTIQSSTMWFEGSLTNNGDGSYSGTIAMVDETVDELGDNEAGFDVYAKEGANATYDKAGSGTEDYACGPVAYHDAYNTGGGWGSFYDPDCADWHHYQLRFDGDNWYLDYNNTGTPGTPVASPMSGTIDWNAMYAVETGSGSYYGSQNPEDLGHALNNTCTGVNDGSGAWDMDWSWGSEYIPLQYPGFDVTVWNLGEGDYRIRLQPASAGSTQLTAEVPDILAISVDPTSIDFGSLVPGQTSNVYDIGVTNVGTVKADVGADVDGSTGDLFFDNLELRNYSQNGSWNTRDWPGIIMNLSMDSSETLRTKVTVPSDYTPAGEENATLTFTATGS